MSVLQKTMSEYLYTAGQDCSEILKTLVQKWVGAKPEASSLHVFNGVGQGLVGGLRQQQGEGRAQQRAQSAKHHGSLRTDAPQEVHHGSQDPSSPGTHGADADPVLSASDGVVRRQRGSNHEETPSAALLSQFPCCFVTKQRFSHQRHFHLC